jgi:hypothetical protein
MGTVHTYGGRIGGSYSGSVRDNIKAIEDSAFQAAAQQFFGVCCSWPDTAWCSIYGNSKTISTHGIKRSDNGKYVLTMEEGSLHVHTDWDRWTGKFKNWQGSAIYNYEFQIVEEVV